MILISFKNSELPLYHGRRSWKIQGLQYMQEAKDPSKDSDLFSIVKLNSDGDLSATFKNHSARIALKAVESAKDMLVFQSSSIVHCKVRKSDMASRKLRFPQCNRQNKICPSRSR